MKNIMDYKKTKPQLNQLMSAARIAVENLRREGEPFFVAQMPVVADSYSPIYNNKIGFGTCTATGNQLRINNCNYQTHGAIPIVNNNSCICLLPNGRKGCNNESDTWCQS